MDIGKSNDNFKDRKLKCFNCNKYRHIVKKCQSKKKEDKQQCFKCDKEKHIAKDCKETQSIKKCKVQEESDNEDKKGQGFGNNLKWAWYKRSPM